MVIKCLKTDAKLHSGYSWMSQIQVKYEKGEKKEC